MTCRRNHLHEPSSIRVCPTLTKVALHPDTRRLRWLFSALYFSEGAPIGFIWWLLPTRLTADGLPLQTVTALSAALVLPWTCKFLWSPFVDRHRAGRWSLIHSVLAAQTRLLPTTSRPRRGTDAI